LKIFSNKRFIIASICFLAILSGSLFFFGNSSSEMTKNFGAFMIIEEKHHHIEPGQYLEMWVIGYNLYEEGENRERYKIYIEESMVYNLIEEGEMYMVSAASFREDEEFGYVYQLEQISNQEEYQFAGKGRIK